MKRSVIAIACAVLPVAHAQIGDFTYNENKDPINDSDRSAIFTQAIDASQFDSPQLIWRCFDGQLEVIYSPDEYLNSDDIPVQYRFDSGEPSSVQAWSHSTTGTAAFARERQVRMFTFGALDASQVVIRAANYNGLEYTYTFGLAEFETALSQLECANTVLAEPAPNSSFNVEFSTPQGIPEAYRRIKAVLESGSYTEELNLVHAQGLDIAFSLAENGRTVIFLSGTNDVLRDRIEELFGR